MKKLLSVLLATILLLTGIPLGAASVSATTIVKAGTTGDCTWELDNKGNLTISGEGKMQDYLFGTNFSFTPWWGDNVVSITIEEGVTAIGTGAFFSCVDLVSVTIPDSVTTIGYKAFTCCENLTSVTIPHSVNTIGFYVFGLCSRLITIVVDDANSKYSSVDGVLFDKDKTTIIQCPGGKSGSYTIPDGVTTIGDYAFEFCGSLTGLVIPNSVTTIGEFAFYWCNNLTSVAIGKGITNISKQTFEGCSNLANVYYGGSEKQAKLISVGSNNDDLLNATWHYKEIAHDYAPATCRTPKTCKICGATSGSKLDHTYTNACDTKCNVCSATRKITHSYKAATCTKAKTCKVCKATSGKALGHKYTNACDTACNTCKATRKITHKYTTVTKKATTTANGYTVKRCSVCKKETGKTTIYKASSIKLSKTEYTYNGKAQKPTVIVKDSNGNKITTSNYTVTYASGRKNVGTYKVTVKFKGNYSGTKTLTFKINPAKTTVKTLTAGKKSLKVAITQKTTQVTGYQIQYSTSKTFKSYKTKTLTSYKKTSLTLTGLSKGKTYYVRVRTYKTVNGVKYYSGWSTVKYKKTK